MTPEILKLVLEIALAVIKSQPPDVAAELWRMHLQDMKENRAFWSQFKLPENK